MFNFFSSHILSQKSEIKLCMMKALIDLTVNELETGQYIFLRGNNYQTVGIYLGLESFALQVIDKYFAEDSNYFHYIVTQETDLNDLYVKLMRYFLFIDLTVLPIKDNINSIEQEYLAKTGQDKIKSGSYSVLQYFSEVGRIRATDMFFGEKELTVSILKEQIVAKIKYSYVDGKIVKNYINSKLQEYEKRKQADLDEVKEKLLHLVKVSPQAGQQLYVMYHEKVLPVEVIRVEKNTLFVRYFYFWFKNEPLEWFRYKAVKENGYLHYTEQEIELLKGVECYAYKDG